MSETAHDIDIPAEALEAAKREAAVTVYRVTEPDTRAHELTEDEVMEIARAACLAMLRAWPGAHFQTSMASMFPARSAGIILPLTTEKQNDKA